MRKILKVIGIIVGGLILFYILLFVFGAIFGTITKLFGVLTYNGGKFTFNIVGLISLIVTVLLVRYVLKKFSRK